MNQPYIEIKSPSTKYALPTSCVATVFANYYSDKITDPKEWQDDYNMIMQDEYEAIDFLIGNYNWSDVKKIWKDELIKLSDIVACNEDWFYDSDNFSVK